MREIEELKSVDYGMWFATALEFHEGGCLLITGQRPEISLFNGVIAGVGEMTVGSEPDVPPALAQATRTFATEFGPDMRPTLLFSGRAITSVTGGELCGAELCESDSRGRCD